MAGTGILTTGPGNNGIFLNAKADTDCPSTQIGCSAYQIASSTATDLVYLKKAPDYLGCYDCNQPPKRKHY
jgi:hypothetical protein